MSRPNRPLEEILRDVRHCSHRGGEFIVPILTMVHNCEAMRAELHKILRIHEIHAIGQILIRTNLVKEEDVTYILDARQARVLAAAVSPDDLVADGELPCYQTDSLTIEWGHDEMKNRLITELEAHLSFTHKQLEILWRVFDGGFHRAHSTFSRIFPTNITNPKEFIFKSLVTTLEKRREESMEISTMALCVLTQVRYNNDDVGEVGSNIFLPVFWCLHMRSRNRLNVDNVAVKRLDSGDSNLSACFFGGDNVTGAAAASSSRDQSPRANPSP